MPRRAVRVVAMLCTAAAAAALSFAAYAAGALDRLEADSVDLRFELRGSRSADDVVVVGIDDTTFDELEVQFPFRRSLHARVIDQLRAAGARQSSLSALLGRVSPSLGREGQVTSAGWC